MSRLVTVGQLNMAKTNNSNISISRMQDHEMNYSYRIMIISNPTSAHQIIVDVEMTAEQFAKAITGLGYIECDVKITQRVTR